MNYHSSQVAAGASLEQHCSDSGISDTSNGTTTASDSCASESRMESLTPPLSSAMSAHSSVKGTPQAIREWLICLPQGSHANRSALPGNEKELTTKEICGRQQQTLFALSSHDAFCLKMCRGYADTCRWSSETCGDLVTPFDDPCSLGLMMLGQSIEGKESGFWRTPNATDGDHGGPNARDSKGGLHLSAQVHHFPTPTVQDAENNGGPSQYERNSIPLNALEKLWPTPRAGKTTDENEETWLKRQSEGKVSTPPLTLAVKMWPTPSASSREGTESGGHPGLAGGSGNRLKLYAMLGKEEGKKMGCQSLNPFWVEWLMCWPIGWTSLERMDINEFEYWKTASSTNDSGDMLREMWVNKEAGAPPQGQETNKQPGECDSPMFVMPPCRAQANSASNMRNLREGVYPEAQQEIETVREFRMQQDSRETISRVAVDVKDRVSRLKALGNGQVPQVVAAAYRILAQEDL